MPIFHADCGDRPLAKLGTVEELDALLDDVAANAESEQLPVGVQLMTDAGPDGHMMTFGLGRSSSFLTFDFCHASGTGNQPRPWWYSSDWTYSRPGYDIPAETAREAAREFVRTGQRPTNVEWVEES